MSQLAVKNLGGAPSKWNDEMVTIARQYVDNYKDHDDIIPSIAGLAQVLGISRETIYKWSKDEDKKGLSDICKYLLTQQERVLLTNGLNSTFNSTITKLVLSKHGYSDTQQNQPSITVNVSRDKVEIETQGQTLTIDQDADGS